ncbi:unnamed protein product [Prorocentrum cordatum]|uniref:Uncharacterized protein n=1 Tax=Prorocentrum cordatum TaxID=2364126 RepID=A0ABN9WGZ0_9DINO|nr:unnamed protein product [Polarella glacialis]
MSQIVRVALFAVEIILRFYVPHSSDAARELLLASRTCDPAAARREFAASRAAAALSAAAADDAEDEDFAVGSADMLTWPSQRTVNVMACLPKPDGITRLIALVSTLVRVWAWARPPLPRHWIRQHPSECVFSLRRGYSAVDSAYSRNIMAEVAHLLGESSITSILDLHKAFNSVLPGPLPEEARLQRLGTEAAPRSLMDDLALQWAGEDSGAGRLALHRAAADFLADAVPLGTEAKASGRALAASATTPTSGAGAHSVTLHPAARRDQCMGPRLDLTILPEAKCCDVCSDGRLPLVRLQRAWRAVERSWLDSKPTRAGLRGPSAAAWISVFRIDWTMQSSLILVTGLGDMTELLQTPPQDAAPLVRDGVHCWQGRQILSHHDSTPAGATLRPLAMRRVLASPRAALVGARAGQLRKLWARASWDLAKRHEMGHLAGPHCQFCPGQVRERMMNGVSAGLGDQGYDRVGLVVGFPLVPDFPQPATGAEVHFCGDGSLRARWRSTVACSAVAALATTVWARASQARLVGGPHEHRELAHPCHLRRLARATTGGGRAERRAFLATLLLAALAAADAAAHPGPAPALFRGAAAPVLLLQPRALFGSREAAAAERLHAAAASARARVLRAAAAALEAEAAARAAAERALFWALLEPRGDPEADDLDGEAVAPGAVALADEAVPLRVERAPEGGRPGADDEALAERLSAWSRERR